MRRGEVWTLRDEHYATKARPVVILQSDMVDEFESVIVTLLTTHVRSSPMRVRLTPTAANGLVKDSYVMTEKLFTVPRSDLGIQVGELDAEQMHAICRCLASVLQISSEDTLPAS